MMEPVQAALQEHSEFVCGGGWAEVKAQTLLPPAGTRSTVNHSQDAREEWPG